MRILRVSHSAVVDTWRERERALRARGHDVRVASAMVWNEFGTDVTCLPQTDEDVVPLRTWGRHPALFVYDPRPLWRELRQAWDVLDIHEEPFSLAAAEVLVIRLLTGQRAPYVLYTAQNLDKVYPPPFRWIERWALRRAAGVSACNREAASRAERRGFLGVADVIPLGLGNQFLKETPTNERPATSRSDQVHVGYAGRLADHKGVDVLLDAVASDERLRLTVAGAGPEHQRLVDRVQKSDLGARVQFRGPVVQDELPAFYRSVDVLAVPSLTTPSWVEQFGRVAIEAMACGTPVVASRSGALPDVVGGAGLLVPPGDATALAGALATVGFDIPLHVQLVDAGLKRARSMSWEAVASQYEGLYAKATGKSSSACKDGALDVVIVAYGVPHLLERALQPLSGFDVVVVDNSSSPAVRKVVEEAEARYVDPGSNLGFAAGVNLGLRHRQHVAGDVLLVNPDAAIDGRSIARLREALAGDSRLASVGPAQVDDEGRSSRVVWPFPTPARTWAEALGLGRIAASDDYAVGSVLLIRGAALRHVGGFDERFFLYAEETDWARRAVGLGWRHALVPSAFAVHIGAASSHDLNWREQQVAASLERYLRKHHGPVGWQVARAGQLFGSAVRSVLPPTSRRNAARRRLSLYLSGPVSVMTQENRGA